ncbi:hypothetical protein CDAR_378381 [Caerostris darwini]|uniref:Uncharacterized protein n=1 Tax=Caerostris darwini TaxID=1538125 RepID=A0AAV4TA90_9ARAC|nr:hypothetical protein CDAR_378381 [Caerostris darwini]
MTSYLLVEAAFILAVHQNVRRRPERQSNADMCNVPAGARHPDSSGEGSSPLARRFAEPAADRSLEETHSASSDYGAHLVVVASLNLETFDDRKSVPSVTIPQWSMVEEVVIENVRSCS